ncbi:alpha-2-macroglobulin family protein [Winogradskyella tangerina]|uniref:alpha-2-macroglobulin family protein n=1 Tax=Winogradskyella tangerina TaxID=2023240 RepID=UPI000DBE277D|nr:alpha-2-macroglobulin family protein [Winogradskyella tangerina]
MKNLISILMLICFASMSNAQQNFDDQWKEVSKLEKDGLTKSAAELVDTIYEDATKINNKQQQIKALLHKSKYMLTLEEEAQLKIVELFKSEIEKTDKIVTKHLLENMLATMYWQYFQQNRYLFYDRSNTAEKVSDDFRTWDLETLFNEIHQYYQRSLQNGLLLQQENLEQYSTLLNEVEGSKIYRPTLFDLLNYNALRFYITSEISITKPAYQFKIDDPALLSDSEVFMNLEISSKDSTSLQLNALKIYQNLIKFHRSNTPTKALVNVDIERLKFVAQHATFDNTDDILINTLQAKAESIKDSPLSSSYNFQIASVYRKLGNQYNANPFQGEVDNTHRWKLKEALELCESVISKYPESDGAKECSYLIKQITRPYLRIQSERNLPTNSPSRLLVEYRNLSALDFTIFEVDINQLETYNKAYNPKEQVEFLAKLKPSLNFTASLKTEGDFQQHSTEIILPQLSNGLYIIKADTNTDENVFASTSIQVTNLALVESNNNNIVEYQLIDRNNGKPIVDAVINITYKNNRNKIYSKMLSSDRFGKFNFKKDKNYYRDVEVRVDYGNETAFFGKYYIGRTYKENSDNQTYFRTFLFTDRSIYRPGQTVYFKGIATETTNEKTSIVENEIVKTTLLNVNGEDIAELELTTNEFGSFHGEFVLPNDGLTGIYRISTQLRKNINTRSATFSVEEYKRPKFKPEFQPITDTYKINDTITVKGKATSFAGSNITDAKVVYRVKRQVQYPTWWYWRRNSYYSSEAQEITFGEDLTDGSGNFEIKFKALPDASVDNASLPIFNYEVTADVTDINGETRSTRTVVKVGYHAKTLNIVAPVILDKTKKDNQLSLISKNLNGEDVPSKGTLKIYKLVAPDHVLRSRPWPVPDYQVISKDEFERLFPHDPYNDEQTITNWKKGKEVFSTDFNTEESKSLSLKRTKKWESGKYIIVAESKDKFGQTVKDETFTTVFSAADKTIADRQLFEVSLNKDTYAIGENAELTLGSAAEGITVTVDVEKDGKIVSTKLVNLNNSKQVLSIPVAKGDLGGFEIHTSFAAFNSYISNSISVNVPYPKTDLSIETSTFRDKLQPGQEETWSFKIKGPKGDKVSAELLASMYDASLDEFRAHNWSFNPISNPYYYVRINKNSSRSFGISDFRLFNQFKYSANINPQRFDQINWFGFYFGSNRRLMQGFISKTQDDLDLAYDLANSAQFEEEVPFATTEVSVGLNYEGGTLNPKNSVSRGVTVAPPPPPQSPSEETSDSGSVQIRKNLNETAFFFPHLKTDKEGNVSFNFKAPEALTTWKLQLLAHTKTLESGITELEAVTQKELMVIPNAPRFLREGDQISISTKIANLSDKTLSGIAQIILMDPISEIDLTNELLELNEQNTGSKEFSVDANGNTQVTWRLKIPERIEVVQYKVIAKSDAFSDGEQNALPVLSNRMLVTETLPMWVRSNQTKTFTFDKLKDQSSPTLKNHKLTLEVTSNPAWYALQALPYLMEYPYECNEQTFAKYYANALAQHVVTSHPKIEAVFNQWASKDALISNLEKNQELKSLLIQETPWLRDAQSESEQKKRIGLLFDLNRMNSELNSALRKLKNNQLPSGAWSWFNGGYENRYITQHIISGFGHLKQLNVVQNNSENGMIRSAISYLDREFVKEYKNITKHNKDADLSKDHLSYMQLHYLYVRSFYLDIKPSEEVESVINYYKDQIKKYWLKRSLYAKGLMALTMHRMDDAASANKILKSLKENSITSDELGMYWKENTNSWYWYQAPIETQALLIEAFSEIENDITTIDNLKIWLLKNKQTNQWKTTKATTEAVYALLLQGSSWLDVSEMVDMKVGKETLNPKTIEDVSIEAGTGFYKTSWAGSEIKPQMANVTMSKKGEGIAWGAMYWQYFEDLDKITTAETPLKLSKKLFLKKNTDTGEEISEITSDTQLNVGDLIRVRIELRTDRTMEFVHLKDMRAAGFEPINVLSQYKWQDGLGYYESTKDAATNFFIDYLPKGVFVFEYDLRVNNAGEMSNGISTIQSMYAPEFSSHSEGIRVTVD